MIDHRIYFSLIVLAAALWVIALPCILIAKPGSSTFRAWMRRADILMVSAVLLLATVALSWSLDRIWA